MKTITLIWPEGEIDALGPPPAGGGFQFFPRDIDQEDDVDTGDGVMIITPWHEEAWDGAMLTWWCRSHPRSGSPCSKAGGYPKPRPHAGLFTKRWKVRRWD